LCDNVGACERIFKSPIPLVYTRHTSRYVGLWLGLLPLAIWAADPSWNHLCTIPVVAVTTFLLLGIEELGLQIEEPFGILPMEAFCDGAIYSALNEAVTSEDRKRALEHAFVQGRTATALAAKSPATAQKPAAAAAELVASAPVASAAKMPEDAAMSEYEKYVAKRDGGVVAPTSIAVAVPAERSPVTSGDVSKPDTQSEYGKLLDAMSLTEQVQELERFLASPTATNAAEREMLHAKLKYMQSMVHDDGEST